MPIMSTSLPGTSHCQLSSSSSPKPCEPTNRIDLCSRKHWNAWGFNRMTFCTLATATWTTSRAQRRQVCESRGSTAMRSEEHTSELQSRLHLVCRLLLEKKKNKKNEV